MDTQPKYGLARINKKWMLTRETDDGLLTILTGHAEDTVSKVLDLLDPSKTSDTAYRVLQVGNKYWIVRPSIGSETMVGIGLAHDKECADEIVRLVSASVQAAA